MPQEPLDANGLHVAVTFRFQLLLPVGGLVHDHCVSFPGRPAVGARELDVCMKRGSTSEGNSMHVRVLRITGPEAL